MLEEINNIFFRIIFELQGEKHHVIIYLLLAYLSSSCGVLRLKSALLVIILRDLQW